MKLSKRKRMKINIAVTVVLAMAMVMAVQAGAQAPAAGFEDFCRAAQREGAQCMRVDGALLRIVRTLMPQENKALFKALSPRSIDILTLDGCSAEMRQQTIEKARALLEGASYTKVPAGKGGNCIYLEKGADEGSFSAVVVLSEADGKSSISRLCGDIRLENLEGLTL